MDFFMSTMTVTQQLKDISEQYKKLLDIDQNGKGRFRLFKGNKTYFGNCMLIILPYISSHGFMNADYERVNLIETLNSYNMFNTIIIYAQPSKSHGPSRTLIKNSREILNNLLEIIDPNLIIVLDDSSAELFLNQKPNIIENHGTIITNHFNIPVVLTYNLDYYNKRTGYEDDNYKKSIFYEDWDYIYELYKERINANV